MARTINEMMYSIIKGIDNPNCLIMNLVPRIHG